MAIELFEGTAQHRGLLGEKGGYIVATNNANFARAFGKDVSGRVGVVKKSKISMYRIGGVAYSSGEKQGVVSVDPRELNRIDALEYVYDHTGEIFDWGELARALGEQYSSQFDIETYAVKPNTKFSSLSDQLQATILRLHCNQISLEEARKIFSDDEANPDVNKNLSDMLARRVRTLNFEETSRVAGVEFTIFATSGNAVKIVRNNNAVKVKLDIFSSVLGNKSRARKEERTRFVEVKKFIEETCAKYSEDCAYSFKTNNLNENIEDLYSEIFVDLRNRLKQTVKEITTNSKFKDYPDFNRASALSKLWNVLGLGSDVNYGGIDETLLERFWREEITSFEFALAPENSMAQRVIKTVVSKRLNDKNVDLESFTDQLTNHLSDDYILEEDPSKNYSKIREIVKKCINSGFEQLKQSISETTDYSIAYRYYSCAIMDFTEYVRNFALEQFVNRYQDCLKADIKVLHFHAAEILERELEKCVTKAYERFVENIKLGNVNDALQPQLPEKVRIRYSETLLKEFMSTQSKLTSDLEDLNDYVREFINGKGDSYYDGLVQNMYDYERGLEAGRNIILENISISPKYKFVQKNYLREILNSLNSMPLMCFLADPNNTDVFIEKYAPEWESNLDEDAIIARKKAKRVKQLLADNKILEEFSLSMKDLFREKLKDFSDSYGLTYADVFAPTTLASDAFFEGTKDDSVLKNVINSLVAEIDTDETEEYLNLIRRQVKTLSEVRGLSFDTLYLKVYLSTDKYMNIAVQNLASLANILPPYRKKTREHWKKVFSDAIKDPSKKMKLISFADRGDIAGAVDLIDVEKDIYSNKITLKVLGGAFDEYRDYLSDKLLDKKITFNGDLVNESEVNKLFTNSLPSVIETYFVENMQNISKNYNLDGEMLIVDKEVAKAIFDDHIKKAIDMIVTYSFIPQAINRAKEILLDSLQEEIPNKTSESSSILITKALNSAGEYNQFPYAEKHDAVGFLNKYYPEWNDHTDFNSLFDDNGDVREELRSSWELFKQKVRDYAIDLATEIICNDLYSNLPSDTKLGLVYGYWVEEKVERFEYMVLSEMINNLSNKTILQQQEILSDSSNYMSQEAINYLRKQLTKEKIDKYAFSEVKQEILAHLKTYFTLVGTLNESAEDLSLWNTVTKRLMESEDLTWLQLYESGELEEFIKNYIPELVKREKSISSEDIRNIFDRELDKMTAKILTSLNSYLKETLGYKFVLEKDIEKYTDHIINNLSDSIKNELLTNVTEGKIYTENEIINIYNEKVDQYIKHDLKKICDSGYVMKVNDYALNLAISETAKTNPYNEKDISFWNAKFKSVPIDSNFVNLAHDHKIDELVEIYASDWNEQLSADEQVIKNRLENSFRNRVMTIIREKFERDEKLLLTQTNFINAEGLLNFVISEKMDDVYLEFKNYVKNRTSVEVVRNFCRRRVFVEDLRKFISSVVPPEEEIRKVVIAKLEKLFSDSIEKADIQKIEDSNLSTSNLIKALNDIKMRNEILKELGITAKFDISRKLELIEVQVSIYDQISPMIQEYARAEPFQEYLIDRKLANDGYYGREKDADSSAEKNSKRIQAIVISKITREWYNVNEFDQLFTAENRGVLAVNVRDEFNRLKPIKFFTPLFSTMVQIFVSRIEELFTSAIENSFKPWLKQTKPYNKIPVDYVNERLQVAHSNNGKDNLISIASHNESYDWWVEKYMAGWKDYIQKSTDNSKDRLQSVDKITIKDTISKELRKLFDSSLTRLVEKNNFPSSVSVAIKNSGQIERLVDEHIEYLLDSVEGLGIDERDVDKVREFIVEDSGYTDSEIDDILSFNIDLEKVRNVLQNSLVSDLLVTGEESEREIQSFTDKLSTEVMAEYYRIGDKNFRNKYVR